jgi:hypothetical protein
MKLGLIVSHYMALTIRDLCFSVLVDAMTIDDETLEDDSITCHRANAIVFIHFPCEMVAAKGDTIITR